MQLLSSHFKVPQNPNEFANWKPPENVSEGELSPVEKAAFELVLNLVCENGLQFANAVPQLLQART